MEIIIVADDSNTIVSIVKQTFEEKYKVLSAKDGKEAIDLINENKLNKIVGMLLDINMPKSDGFEVLDYLKNNNLFSKVPVSIITGDDDMNVISKAFEYDIIDVLKKPFTKDNVKKIVDKTISIRSINNM